MNRLKYKRKKTDFVMNFKRGRLFLLGIFSLLVVFPFFLASLVSVANGQSPEASPTATNDSDQLDEKVQDIRDAVKEKVEEKLAEVKKGEKRGFVGEITDITNSTLFIELRSGEKQVKVDEEAEILDEKREEIEIEDLEIGQFVIAMGYLEDEDILSAKRVVLIPEPEPLNREIAVGTVTDISEKDVLTVKNESKAITYTIEITNKTKVTEKVEGEIEEVEFSDIELGDFLVAVGTPEENEEKIITAKIIRVVPGQGLEASDERSEGSEELEETRQEGGQSKEATGGAEISEEIEEIEAE